MKRMNRTPLSDDGFRELTSDPRRSAALLDEIKGTQRYHDMGITIAGLYELGANGFVVDYVSPNGPRKLRVTVNEIEEQE